MTIELNKVTWYSRLSAIVLFIIIIPILAFYLGYKYRQIEDAWHQAKISEERLLATPFPDVPSIETNNQ